MIKTNLAKAKTFIHILHRLKPVAIQLLQTTINSLNSQNSFNAPELAPALAGA